MSGSRFFKGAGERPRIPHLAKATREIGDLREDVEDGFQRVQDEHEAAGIQASDQRTKFTPEGGLAVRLINKTGAASVKGSLVKAGSAVDNSVVLNDALGGLNPIGAVYEDGIADGQLVWVVISGVAEVLLEDGTAATRGYWASSGATAGRVDCTTADAPGLVLSHFQEVGHCLQSVNSGTDVLARCLLHFN
jgi:hypothetical protein